MCVYISLSIYIYIYIYVGQGFGTRVGGCFKRGWFRNTRFRSKQHGKQHRGSTDTTCNNVFVEATPFETTPYASLKKVGLAASCFFAAAA